MAQSMPGVAPASIPTRSESGRLATLPRDPGRATEILYRRHGATVFRYAWHLLGRREDAEDATQATFLAAHAALTSGTAVLEPGAWVIRIARNECMGRLRRNTPAPELLGDDVAAATVESVESAAEVRDEMRIARRTLSLLPEQQREAFVLREWLGLETTEVALALGVAATGVDDLTAQARRSLVLAVGGLEPAVGCAATRTSLESGTLDRAGKVHLLRCPVCRGVRRALSPRAFGGAPAPAVAARLAGMLPGFGAGGGGIIAALTAKAATAPIVAKTAALVAATVLTGGAVGEAIRTSHPAHIRSAGGSAGRGGPAALAGAAGNSARRAALVLVTPAAVRHSTAAPAAAALVSSTTRRSSASRGGAGQGSDDSGRAHDSAGGKGSSDQRDEHGREQPAGSGGSPDDKAGEGDSGRSQQSRHSSDSGGDVAASRDGSIGTGHEKATAHESDDGAPKGAASDGGGESTAANSHGRHGGGDDGLAATPSSAHGGSDPQAPDAGEAAATDSGVSPAATEAAAPAAPDDASGAPAATPQD